MKCHSVERSLSAYLDGLLSGQEGGEVAAHLTRCAPCTTRSQQLQQVRSTLRRMTAPQAPDDLAMQLKVMASRELARRREQLSYSSPAAMWVARCRLCVENLMRPLAIPFAGGLVSTMVLFSILLPAFSPLAVTHPNDIPTVLTTDPTLMSAASFGLGDEEVSVDLTIDEQGRMVNYSVSSGPAWAKDPAIRSAIENTLLFSRFQPATMFGMPATGKVRITLRRSAVDVKG